MATQDAEFRRIIDKINRDNARVASASDKVVEKGSEHVADTIRDEERHTQDRIDRLREKVEDGFDDVKIGMDRIARKLTNQTKFLALIQFKQLGRLKEISDTLMLNQKLLHEKASTADATQEKQLETLGDIRRALEGAKKSLLQRMRDSFTNLFGVLPNRAERLRSRRAARERLAARNRDIRRTNAAVSHIKSLEVLAELQIRLLNTDNKMLDVEQLSLEENRRTNEILENMSDHDDDPTPAAMKGGKARGREAEGRAGQQRESQPRLSSVEEMEEEKWKIKNHFQSVVGGAAFMSGLPPLDFKSMIEGVRDIATEMGEEVRYVSEKLRDGVNVIQDKGDQLRAKENEREGERKEASRHQDLLDKLKKIAGGVNDRIEQETTMRRSRLAVLATVGAKAGLFGLAAATLGLDPGKIASFYQAFVRGGLQMLVVRPIEQVVRVLTPIARGISEITRSLLRSLVRLQRGPIPWMDPRWVKRFSYSLLRFGRFVSFMFSVVGNVIRIGSDFASRIVRYFNRGPGAGILRFFGRIGRVLSRVFAPLALFIGGFEAITTAVQKFREDGLLGGIIGGFSRLLDFFTFGIIDFDSLYESIMGGLKRIFGGIKSLFTEGLSWNAVGDILGGVGDLLLALPRALVAGVGNMVKWVTGWIYRDTSDEESQSAFGGFINGLRDRLKKVLGVIGDVFDAVGSFFGTAYTTAKGLINQGMNLVKNIFDNILLAVHRVLDTIPLVDADATLGITRREIEARKRERNLTDAERERIESEERRREMSAMRRESAEAQRLRQIEDTRSMLGARDASYFSRGPSIEAQRYMQEQALKELRRLTNNRVSLRAEDLVVGPQGLQDLRDARSTDFTPPPILIRGDGGVPQMIYNWDDVTMDSSYRSKSLGEFGLTAFGD